jgi:hypothetical protein
VIAHLNLLSALHRAWGAMGVLLGLSMLLLAGGAAAIGWTRAGEALAAGFMAAVFAVFAAALLVAGGVNVWAGTALERRQAFGRTMTLALAVPNLFVLPFGTALGIYAFWVLLHNDSRRMFESGG